MDELLVADSFRVRKNPVTGDTEVRRFDWHLERFRASAEHALASHFDQTRELAHSRGQLDVFMRDLPKRIAAAGEGFPRIELRGRDRVPPTHTDAIALHLLLRPLPALGTEIEMISLPRPDLVTPRVKGPNIERLLALTHNIGAEALLIEPEGYAIEGSTTSLVWWDDDRLMMVDNLDRVPSVTEKIVHALAARHGIPTGTGEVTPQELAHREVWAINALHGIRTVRSIDGAILPVADAARLHRFRELLDGTWQPLV